MTTTQDLRHGGVATFSAGINNQTGTTYTLAVSDNGGIINLYNANPITLTVPQAATVAAIPTGFNCVIRQTAAGKVTVVKEGSDHLMSADSLVSLRTTNSSATICMIGDYAGDTTRTWTLDGDLTV